MISMKTKTVAARPAVEHLLCSKCGNTDRFFQVMAEEVHLVDGQMNYIRLFESIVDHYACCECSEAVAVTKSTVK